MWAGDMAEIRVKSELNALVWKIEASVGASVNEGDALIILEAMKMEIPVKAHKSGTVEGLTTEAGASVSSGTAICEIKTRDAVPVMEN